MTRCRSHWTREYLDAPADGPAEYYCTREKHIDDAHVVEVAGVEVTIPRKGVGPPIAADRKRTLSFRVGGSTWEALGREGDRRGISRHAVAAEIVTGARLTDEEKEISK